MPPDSEPEVKRIVVKSGEPAPQPDAKRFWETLPGLLTAVGGTIGAIAALITALSAIGVVGSDKATPTPTLAPSPVEATVTGTPTATLTQTPPPDTPTATLSDTLTPSAAPTLAALTTTPTATRPTTWRDDLDSPGNLTTGGDETYETSFAEGEYRIAVYPAQYEAWTTVGGIPEAGDLIVEVDAHRVSGTLDNDFGILVRYQAATDSFYMFVVSSDGFFKVLRHDEDRWVDLVAWAAADAIGQGDEGNRLRVECVGPRMRFSVNGVLLTEVIDATYASGTIGLVAGTGEEGGVIIGFDNLLAQILD